MKIGFFEAGLPNYDHDAGSTAVIELCSLIQSMGHVLDYFYTGDNPWGRESDLAARHISFSRLPLADVASKTDFLRQKNIDMAII